MSGAEFEEWLQQTGVGAVEIAMEFGDNQSKLSEYRRGLKEIPDEFVERVIPWGARVARTRAEYAEAATERFASLRAAAG